MIKDLIQREPWRIGQGRPYTALDPTWKDKSLQICDGEVVWDTEDKWWFCRECGCCSCWPQTLHYQAEHPSVSYERNLKYFYAKRLEQGITEEVAKLQALHIAGAALKAAAMQAPTEVRRFIDENILPR